MKKSILLIGVAALAFGACNDKDKTNELNGDEKLVDVTSISGNVQKGPFINGTSVRVAELNSALQQTGRSFETQIADNSGAFELKSVGRLSQYVELHANGYYYNEVKDDVSESQLSLYALTDLSSGTTPNINVLTTLERPRVEYLTSGGTSFADAKSQAQAEIFDIFKIDHDFSWLEGSERFNIASSGQGDAALLAVSAIMQGNLTAGAASELIANVASDIRTDGKLDDAKLGSKLKGNAMAINPDEIRANLANRYKELGVEAAVPDFGGIVRNFAAKTEFELQSNLEFPSKGEFGKNVLAINDTACMYGGYSMAVKVPAGTELDIKVSSPMRCWSFEVLPGVNYSTWNEEDHSRHFRYSGPCTVDIHLLLSKVERSEIYDWIGDNKHVVKEFENNKVKFEVFENGVLTMAKNFTILQEETCTEDFTKDENYPNHEIK
ncbi:MAG: hypothetical protein J6W13_12745 [Salinivirgaceae bacterium]|nr:hypothetical protein [Salinivirgaceae bacterium]